MAKKVVEDVFGSAPTKDVPKKADKKTKAGVESGPALAKVAAIDFITKSLKGLRETYEGMAKDEMLDKFVEDGLKAGKRPENYRGVSGLGEASCELKKRATSSPVSEDEVSELTKMGIEVKLETVQEEMFVFNPEILKNPELRAKISAAFAKIDFGGVQPIERIAPVQKYVASEEAIEAVFKTAKTPAVGSKLLSMVTTLAIKSKWNGTKAQAYELLSAEEEKPETETVVSSVTLS